VQFTILTLFPGMLAGPLRESILGRAVARGLVDLHLEDIRAHTHDRHRTVDDVPFGGGSGMVLKPEPVARAVSWARTNRRMDRLFLLSPQGERFDQAMARRLARLDGIGLLCGHYEGVDERILLDLVDGEISVGDFVLSGGEIPAMILVDAVTRLLPGVVGHPDSTRNESFEEGRLDCPVYTRPEVFEGRQVPEALMSGNHALIRRWRDHQRRERTRQRRPDLLNRKNITNEVNDNE